MTEDAIEHLPGEDIREGPYLAIALEDVERGIIGADLDIWPNGAWQVVSIANQGAISKWNASHSDAKAIRVNDFIITVDGKHVVKEYPQAWEAYMKDGGGILKLELVRPEFHTIKVSKGNNPWGLKLGYQDDSNCVRVKSIDQGLAVDTFNATAHEQERVVPGDFISSANGCTGSTSILKELQSKTEAEMLLFRIPN